MACISLADMDPVFPITKRNPATVGAAHGRDLLGSAPARGARRWHRIHVGTSLAGISPCRKRSRSCTDRICLPKGNAAAPRKKRPC